MLKANTAPNSVGQPRLELDGHIVSTNYLISLICDKDSSSKTLDKAQNSVQLHMVVCTVNS